MQSEHTVYSAVDSQGPLNPLTYVPSASTFDPDFWDPTILSTTNWLDAVIDDDFAGWQFDFDVNSSTANDTTAPSRTDLVGLPGDSTRPASGVLRIASVTSPAAASNASVHSGASTETAAEICAAQEAPTQRVGDFYVDGEPARLTRTKRRKICLAQEAERKEVSHSSTFSLRLTLSSVADLKHRIHVSGAIYLQISNMWRHTCLESPLPWPMFEATDFPCKEIFEHLIGLYFARFHQTLPFLHPVTFDGVNEYPLLLLAIASIGALFFDHGNPAFATSLSEIVRRNLVLLKEDLSRQPDDALAVAKAQLLLAVSLAYCRDTQSTVRGLDMQRSLASTFVDLTREWTDSPSTQTESTETQWKAWIRREQIVRVAYSTWLLDCMWAYQFQRRSILALGDAVIPLPCHEKLWNANSAEEWENLSQTHGSPPSLQSALQELYVDKRLPRERGEFARIVMIHGLFQRAWEVHRYYSNPLSQWEPTAQKQSSRDVLPSEPVALLALPTYSKWQNSACDCIDILHWQANATIGQASGLEHPTVAFLHLSRIVLLSPIDNIVRYAKALIGVHKSTTFDANRDEKVVQRWATQGQYKARLAVIHAGVVFWHIRRYSIDAFYEAPAVAFAALMLWSFGKYAPRQNSQHKHRTRVGQSSSNQAPRNESESPTNGSEDSACGIILLDRPADDEIVQQFVRRGHTMRTHITGVGDLYGPHGPQRVLLEGCKLLQSLSRWGVNETWLDILQRLHQTCLDKGQQ